MRSLDKIFCPYPCSPLAVEAAPSTWRRCVYSSHRESKREIFSYRRIWRKRCTKLTHAFLRDPYSLAKCLQGLLEAARAIEDDRKALEAQAAIKIRKIEVDYEGFEVSER